jgi:hypothetical protein
MVSGMKSRHVHLTAFGLIALTACSTQEIKRDSSNLSKPVTSVPSLNEGSQLSGQNPPLTVMKGTKKLNLVRVMDGGACKNDLQGVKGTFLLYANPDDIERIKTSKGTKVFSEFENQIQTLSTDALQQAINESNLAEDPFALGEEEAQEKLAKQLSAIFLAAIAGPILNFEKETTLTIAITPFTPSFIFYQKGCEAIQTDDNTEANQ